MEGNAYSTSRMTEYAVPLILPNICYFTGHAAPKYDRRGQVLVRAKKKGKGGQTKGPGSLIDIPIEPQPETVSTVEPWQETGIIMDNLLLVESYSRNVGQPLLQEETELADIAERLWEAPFALLAHELPEDDVNGEPILTYANKLALELFETEWEDFVGKPSSITTEQNAKESRAEILKEVQATGKCENFSGWRVSTKGKRFQIQGGTIFNICSPTGEILGQGAKIPQWQLEDGSAEGQETVAHDTKPDFTDMEAADGLVQEQAEVVRELKEGRGLSNKDPEVISAVQLLLERKEKQKSLRERLASTSDT